MILVLNCGSQSIKWKVFDQKLKPVKEGLKFVLDQNNFQEILEQELKSLKEFKIDLIGHRVVHGKNLFCEPLKINEENIKQLETLNYLAPLHNPYNILGIKTCQKLFQDIPQIAVFDTEFFKDLPEVAYTYALPEFVSGICLPADRQGYRKYGFHGISHEFVASSAVKAVSDKKKTKKIITVHLGGGASITAIKNGKAVDTSMGFTPMQGLVMMTRAGDMDFGIVLEMAKQFGLDRTTEILNKESGVKGICNESDMFSVLQIIKNRKTESPERSQRVMLALDVFVYSIKKYIGSYFAVLGGCDVLVFTGSIGSGSKKIRDMVCKNLDILKKTKIMAIETDEELAIAQKIIKIK
jgi:acetate kinase